LLDRAEAKRQSDRLYEAYGKPLEAEHWGLFVAIYPDGRFFVGDDLTDLAIKTDSEIGPGFYLYRVGERVVGKLR
jgi:hypothetical protein